MKIVIYQDSPPSFTAAAPPSLPFTPPPSLPGVPSSAILSSSPTPLSCRMKKAEEEANLYLQINTKWLKSKEALEARRKQQMQILMSMR
ncbi:hypothetical protein Lal_00021763 [Lupinus albus]|nr:hypothetical protein Lal_00021763 [Lupinus albus]